MKLPLIGLKVSTGTLALGALAFMAAPQILAAVGSVVRPVAKTGIKGGMIVYDKGKDMFSGTVDSIQDVASEVRSELSKGSKAAPKKKAT
jgi:hypothetical protein